MTYEKKARDLCNPLAGFIPFADLLALHGAITAALIEARRAALEEAAVHFDGWGSDYTAKEIRALIPTRPDGAAEGEPDPDRLRDDRDERRRLEKEYPNVD